MLRVLAGTGRALEVNTRLPLDALVVRWWHQEGGDAVSFGSDAHSPDRLSASPMLRRWSPRRAFGPVAIPTTSGAGSTE